jgi:hypothetical protein
MNIKIYEIGLDSYWTGGERDIDDISYGVEVNWTRDAIPSLNEGEYAIWVGNWEVVTTPPPLTPYDRTFDNIIRIATRLITTQKVIAKIAAKGQE